ncbi:MAG: sulfatase [Fuerstiella sp.]
MSARHRPSALLIANCRSGKFGGRPSGIRLFATLTVLLVVSSDAVQSAERPNILFIMSDDHTAQAVGAYATLLKPLNPTPNIDRLAAEGMCFDNAFCTNAICTPSRACIITGQYNHINGVFDLGGKIEPSRQMLPIQMRKAGYQTAIVGKWHLKVEPNFDYYKVLPGQGKYFDPEFRVQGDRPWPKNVVRHEGYHSSDAITDSTLEWLREKRDPDRPFFLCHQFKAPHDYFESAPRYDSYLADVEIPEPDTLWTLPDTWGSLATRGHNDELVPHIGTSIGRRNPRRSYARDLPRVFPKEFQWDYDDPTLSDYDIKRLAYQAYLKKYLRCVKGVDDNLKRIMDYLKAEDLYDNTLIIYTGDQGFWLGEKDYQDKRWAYDPSERMPFIVRYPKAIPAGTRSDAIIENIDYPALMLDYAEAEIPATVQGRSFRAICETGREPEDWKQATYYRYWMHMAHHDNPGEMAIRTKTHKLIYFYGCNYDGADQTPAAWELYDLVKDPAELNNVYDDPAYAQIRDDLKTRLAQLRTDIGDDGSHYPECERVVQQFWDYDDADRARAIQVSHDFRQRREKMLEGK